MAHPLFLSYRNEVVHVSFFKNKVEACVIGCKGKEKVSQKVTDAWRNSRSCKKIRIQNQLEFVYKTEVSLYTKNFRTPGDIICNAGKFISLLHFLLQKALVSAFLYLTLHGLKNGFGQN